MANFDRKALDASRKLNNQPPISDEEFAALNSNGLSEEEKQAQLKKQQEEEAAKKAEEEKNKLQDQKVYGVDDVTDDVALEYLRKKGIDVSSIDQLRQQEQVDREKAAEERESEKLSWGLKNKKIKPKEYEGYIAASKDPQNLVYATRLQAAKKEDPSLDEKEFREEFEEEFGLDQNKDSRRFKNGQDTLNRLADAILKNSYSPIYNLENEYAGYENSQKTERERQNKIKAEAPAYKASVEKVFSGLKKIKANLGKDDDFEIEASEGIDNILGSIKDSMLSADFAGNQIVRGYSEEELRDLAFTALLKQGFPLVAEEFAKQYLRKHAAGTKGIPPIGGKSSSEGVPELSDGQKVLKNMIEANKVPENAN
jgi:hypothetical protein